MLRNQRRKIRGHNCCEWADLPRLKRPWAPTIQTYISRARDLVSATLVYARLTPVSYSKNGGLQITDLGHESILMHATRNLSHKPNQQVSDVGVVYADYYLLEALVRLASLDCD